MYPFLLLHESTDPPSESERKQSIAKEYFLEMTSRDSDANNFFVFTTFFTFKYGERGRKAGLSTCLCSRRIGLHLYVHMKTYVCIGVRMELYVCTSVCMCV